MRVMDERLAPGVEDGKEADLGAEVTGVGADGAECLGDGAEEEPVDDGLVLGGELGDRRGYGEDRAGVVFVDGVIQTSWQTEDRKEAA